MNLKVRFMMFALCVSSATAVFDCETLDDSSAACPSELRCVYDELYEAPVRTCQCKIAVDIVSLPHNRLNSEIFEKICSRRKERLEKLVINDIELEIIDNGIFEHYRNLKYLDLAKNNIKLNFTKDAERIVELNLSFNKIGILEPNVFKHLESVRILNASFNTLKEVSSVFEGLNNLETIDLSNNRLTHVRTEEFADLQKLRILNLAHNFLNTVENTLPSSLQELHLNDNRITTINKQDFFATPNLKILNLSRNLINNLQSHQTEKRENNSDGQNLYKFSATNQNAARSRYPWENYQNLNDLLASSRKSLPTNPYTFNNQKQVFAFKPDQIEFSKFGNAFSVVNNDFTNRLKQAILGNNVNLGTTQDNKVWTKLQELNLAQNKIRMIPDGFLDDLEEMKIFNVSHNALIEFNLNKLNSPKLEQLDLKDNFLSDVDLEVVKNKWPLLKIIDLDFNSIKCSKFNQVLDYFAEKEIIFKSCVKVTNCCN